MQAETYSRIYHSSFVSNMISRHSITVNLKNDAWGVEIMSCAKRARVRETKRGEFCIGNNAGRKELSNHRKHAITAEGIITG